MYKSIEGLNPKIKKFQNLAILPGFDYNLEPYEKSNILKINNTILKDKDVINENIFVKFFSYVDESKNNSTRKKKLKSLQKKQSKRKNRK